MSRTPVVCVWPDGETFRVSRDEANSIVSDDLGFWDGHQTVRMRPVSRSGGRLSLRVGGRLATAVYRNESWARTMLEEINR
jgi:hypothetical protein